MELTRAETVKRLVEASQPALRAWLVGPAGNVHAVRAAVERAQDRAGRAPKPKSLAAWRGEAPEKYGDYGGLDWAISQMVKARTGAEYPYPYWSSNYHNWHLPSFANRPDATLRDVTKTFFSFFEPHDIAKRAMQAESPTRSLDYAPPVSRAVLNEVERRIQATKKGQGPRALTPKALVQLIQTNVLRVMGGLLDAVEATRVNEVLRVEGDVQRAKAALEKHPVNAAMEDLSRVARDMSALGRAAEDPATSDKMLAAREALDALKARRADYAQSIAAHGKVPSVDELLAEVFESEHPSQALTWLREGFAHYPWRKALADVRRGAAKVVAASHEPEAPTGEGTDIETFLRRRKIDEDTAEAVRIGFSAAGILDDVADARGAPVAGISAALYHASFDEDAVKAAMPPATVPRSVLRAFLALGIRKSLLREALPSAVQQLKDARTRELSSLAARTIQRARADFDWISARIGHPRSAALREDAMERLDAWNSLATIREQVADDGIAPAGAADVAHYVDAAIASERDYLNSLRGTVLRNPRGRR